MENRHGKLGSVSAFFPCYNDAGTIASLVVSTFRTLREVAARYEVIVVDDRSADHSLEILEELERVYPDLRVIARERNGGYGAALRSGFGAARYDYVFYTDGDGQYDPRELRLLAREMEKGVDVVNGYKKKRHDPFYRLLLGWIYSVTVKTLFRLKIRDVDCDFRLIRKSALEGVPLDSNDGAICVEMVKKLERKGAVFREVPVSHFYRTCGRSQVFMPIRVARGARTVLKHWVSLCVRPFLKNRFGGGKGPPAGPL